ncbi:MAG: DUF2520 domain-containing protein [Gemmatimonadetes bacterium]|nr:DUF2520 domain-containing protein [Gemmatimonadota bacterium]
MPPWLGSVPTVLLAVPDSAVTSVAAELARSGAITPNHTVLHVSGVLDRGALSPLGATGAALGSFHPLQTLADAATAPERLRGAVAAVEGDARAVQVAEGLARGVGLRPVAVPATAKPLYHAGAVFASNYVVTVSAVARRLLQEAGIPPEVAWQGLLPLIVGAGENLRGGSPEEALTGPIARGDVETIRRHLAALSPEDARLYRLLGREALRIATLDPERRAAVEAALRE